MKDKIMDLSRVATREKLRPRREPYWQRLSKGRFLGYRPSKIGGAGGWIAKHYEPEQRTLHALGDYGHVPANERFTLAKKDAENWFQHLEHGGETRPVTVREACEKYAASRPEAAQRFERHVFGDAIASVVLHKLTKAHVTAWRHRLEDKPSLVSRNKDGETVTRPRAAATINRDLVAFRAALNAAKADGLVATDQAWAVALRPVEGASRRRNLYLDRGQRARLLEHLPADAAAFVRGLCSLPLRPGALAALTVGDFDPRRKELVVARDKSGGERKILVPAETAALLAEQARGKLPGAVLFMRTNGKAWDKETWKHPIAAAVRAARLPAETTAYTLRHSTITDLVTGGLDLLTTAQLAGTSAAMIERHYGHLQRHRAADALAGLAL